MKHKFDDQFTRLQKEIVGRLAEIEQEDSNYCSMCGGEDCVCCEIYLDRQKWSSPEELLREELLREETDYEG